MAYIFHFKLFKTFLSHPSLLLLPTFTCFTFESNIKKCCRKKSLPTEEVEIRFSMRATGYNIFFSAIVLSGKFIFDFFSDAGVQGMIELMVSYQGVPHKFVPKFGAWEGWEGWEGWDDVLLRVAFASLFTFAREVLRHLYVFNLFLMMRFNSFLFELGVYKPSAPRKVFVFDQRSKEVVEVKVFEVDVEMEVEMVALQDSATPDEGEKMAIEAEVEDKV